MVLSGELAAAFAGSAWRGRDGGVSFEITSDKLMKDKTAKIRNMLPTYSRLVNRAYEWMQIFDMYASYIDLLEVPRCCFHILITQIFYYSTRKLDVDVFRHN